MSPKGLGKIASEGIVSILYQSQLSMIRRRPQVIVVTN